MRACGRPALGAGHEWGDGAVIFRWNRELGGQQRKGQPCTITARGALNSVRVVFDNDGWTVITSRHAVRRA